MKELKQPRLKEDVLAHLGPKMAWYTVPTKKAAGPAGLAGMAIAGLEIPRFALVCDIDDPSAVGKVLDQAMTVLNRQLKTIGKPPVEAPAKGARGKAAAGPSIELQLMPGEPKGYVLKIPPEMAGQIPSSFRPAIRVGPKHLVIASSSDVVKLVLDLKGTWTPPNDLSSAYAALPTNLKMINVSDPRETLPNLLASLPGTIQQLAGAAMMAAASQRPPGGGPPPAQPPAGPPPLILKVDAAKLPSAESIRTLLFSSLLTVEATDEEIRVVSRDAFPSLGDPKTLAVQTALILPAIQAARDAARRAQANNQKIAPPDGFFDVPPRPAAGKTPAKPKGEVPKPGAGATNPN